jgi:putative oxidoreductase
MDAFYAKLQPVAHASLRLAAGCAYFSHGAQKFLGWFGGFGADGGTADLMSRFGAAGVIETFAGALLIVGLFTRPVAFVASGQMAVTYFWMHWARSGEMWWWENRGEVVLLYAFIWLLFSAIGAGPFSIDAWRRKARETRERGDTGGAAFRGGE